MLVNTVRASYTSARCLQRSLRPNDAVYSFRRLYAIADSIKPGEEELREPKISPIKEKDTSGAFSRRLEDLTERALEDAGGRAAKVVEDPAFSPELKRELEARILQGQDGSDDPQASSILSMPSAAGKGTRDIAAAQAWQGTEKLEDAALRMLDDAHKPLRGGHARTPRARVPSLSVDTRMKQATTVQRSHGQRLANARDKTSIYALTQDTTMSAQEREQMRTQLKERFTPGARPMPSTVRGLAALANERIEDAIARGQFKNIPRGTGRNIERDHNARSPFLDTTEYFLNKIIRKQDIVPPWIEKQQELGRAVAQFRSRLRHDWKRHAARMIASRGGSVEEQVRRAEAYAAAEARLEVSGSLGRQSPSDASSNPGLDTRAHPQLESRLGPPIDSRPDSRFEPRTSTTKALNDSNRDDSGFQSTLIKSSNSSSSLSLSSTSSIASTASTASTSSLSSPPPPPPPLPHLPPFRDPAWEALELTYHTLALTSLNTLTRSYNLVAPSLAQRPSFRLVRELRACFADVAPRLPDEIRGRAGDLTRRQRKSANSGANTGGANVGAGETGVEVEVEGDDENDDEWEQDERDGDDTAAGKRRRVYGRWERGSGGRGERRSSSSSSSRRGNEHGGGGGGTLEWLGGDRVKVWEDRRKAYGLREFWRDLFAK